MAVASALLIPVEFSVLESSRTQKVVIFHDPNNEESVKKLEVMEKIDTMGTYGSEYEYVVCDVTLTQNVNEVQKAGFKEFPQIFTQTNEGGIEPYGGDFSTDSFAQFHMFRMMDLTENNVQRVKDTDGVGDVDGVKGLLTLSADRPVFVKMYEEWCGHCKRMKRHFEYASNTDTAVVSDSIFLEVECSK
ncbi:hypothetical protein T484DRAFT_1758154, partial [Baffinella frigidus]